MLLAGIVRALLPAMERTGVATVEVVMVARLKARRGEPQAPRRVRASDPA